MLLTVLDLCFIMGSVFQFGEIAYKSTLLLLAVGLDITAIIYSTHRRDEMTCLVLSL